LKILWITGRLPYPTFSGDAVYSRGLLNAAANLTSELRVVGHLRPGHDLPPRPFTPHECWIPCGASTRFAISSLFSLYPKDVYLLATQEMRSIIKEGLKGDWDWIVIDHANSSASIDLISRDRRGANICYVAHNAEGLIRPRIASTVKPVAKRSVMTYDAVKYAFQERRILHLADLVIAITNEDNRYFSRYANNVHTIRPCYIGRKSNERYIKEDTHRSILLLGSFEWVAKQENVINFLSSVGARLRKHEIGIKVAGNMPDAFKAQMIVKFPYVDIRAQVADIYALMRDARIGVVPEVLGGGFKLKILDYAFARLPICGLKDALSGLDAYELGNMLVAESFEEMGDMIVKHIDDFYLLNKMQMKSYEVFEETFGLSTTTNCLQAALRSRQTRQEDRFELANYE
jgi:glycosyltransferase involved in cell wall biosynthesis